MTSVLFSSQAAKAWLGALIAGVSVLVAGAQAGFTGYEYATAGLAFLVALGGVYGVRNDPTYNRRMDDLPPDSGGGK